MKKSFFLFGVLFILFSSCVKQESSTQSSNTFVRVNADNYPITVQINENDSAYFEEDITIDLSGSSFIIDNFSGVVSYELEQLKINFSEFAGNELALADLTISFVDSNNTIGSPITYSNIPLYEFQQNQTSITVNHSQTTLQQLKASMNYNKELVVHVEGRLSEKPASFKAIFFINIKISSK
jgi:hypothetical protein